MSPSLLAIAAERIRWNGWTNARAVRADATTFRPLDDKADVVTFSYALTMIPDWFAAIENAFAMLNPGGVVGVADFYVSRKHPVRGINPALPARPAVLAGVVCPRQCSPVA